MFIAISALAKEESYNYEAEPNVDSSSGIASAMSEKHIEKFLKIGENSAIINCAKVFEFEIFAVQLISPEAGIDTEGMDPEQTAQYLGPLAYFLENDGQLKVQERLKKENPNIQVPEPLKVRCGQLASAAVEAMALITYIEVEMIKEIMKRLEESKMKKTPLKSTQV